MSSDQLLSLRTSCDRCHRQKLKCKLQPSVTTEGSDPLCCTRCAKACVTCIYSRRRPAQNVVNNNTEHSTDLPDDRSTQNAASCQASDHGTNLGLQSLHDNQSWPSLTMLDTGVNLTNLDRGFNSNILAGLGSPVSPSTLVPHETVARIPLAAEFLTSSEFDSYLFDDMDLGLVRRRLGQNSLPESISADSIANIASSAKHQAILAAKLCKNKGSGQGERASHMRCLLKLASELEDGLEVLQHDCLGEAGPRGHSMNGFPIGTVLHLLQQYIQGAANRGQENNNTGSDDTFEPSYSLQMQKIDTRFNQSVLPADFSSRSAVEKDVSVMLLISSCSITLIQICEETVARFQKHLGLNSMSDQEMSFGHASEAARSMSEMHNICLGELPAISQMDCRLYTAIGMLLNLICESKQTFQRYCAIHGTYADYRGNNIDDGYDGVGNCCTIENNGFPINYGQARRVDSNEFNAGYRSITSSVEMKFEDLVDVVSKFKQVLYQKIN